jgi:hypothetical protein
MLCHLLLHHLLAALSHAAPLCWLLHHLLLHNLWIPHAAQPSAICWLLHHLLLHHLLVALSHAAPPPAGCSTTCYSATCCSTLCWLLYNMLLHHLLRLLLVSMFYKNTLIPILSIVYFPV